MSKLKGLVWVGVAVGLGAVAAVGVSSLARHVPWSVERRLGSVAGVPNSDAVCGGSAAAARGVLEQLVRRIYPLSAEDREIPISITVIRGATINAYATLGGKIYVYDGLLQQAQSPEELAGVLAHEIEHVRQRHIIQGAVVSLVTWGGLQAIFQGHDIGIAHTLLSLSFSREQEAEADEGGLNRLRSARIDAAGFANFFARARHAESPPAILSSHPADDERAARAARFTGYPTDAALTKAEWNELRGICGAKRP